MTTNTNDVLRSAAKSALEALEALNGVDTETESVTIHVSDEIAALRAALAAAQPAVQQEPVAIVTRFHDLGGEIDWTGRAKAPVGAKLYLAASVVQEDAARYRWLRENAYMGYPSGEGSRSKDAYLVVTGYGYKQNDRLIDAAIDAVRSQAKEGAVHGK